MHKETITYKVRDKTFRGYLCHNRDISSPRPAVLVAHAWYGLDAFARERAEALARMGYIAFAADLYGNEQPVKNDDEAAQLMTPLFLDRYVLQERIATAFFTLAQHPLVDIKRVGAIGFCFGGLTVLELLRGGAPVRGVVSFHGGIGKKRDGKEAKIVPLASKIAGSALILHGHDDPSVSPEDIAALQTEFTQAKIDWTMTVYGNTMHAFTNPEANNPSKGMQYNEKTARRSWKAMIQFFDDIFKF